MPRNVDVQRLEIRDGYYLIVYRGRGKGGAYYSWIEGPYFTADLAGKRLREQGYTLDECEHCHQSSYTWRSKNEFGSIDSSASIRRVSGDYP